MKPLAFVLCVCFSVSLHAQEISPLVSFEFGSPLFFNRDAGVLNQFEISASQPTSCYTYGIGADARWPRLAGTLGVASNLQFLYSTGHFSFDAARASVDGVDRKVQLELTALLSESAFSVRAGGWASQRISANVDEHDSTGTNITPPKPTSSAFHAGVVLGAEYLVGNLRTSLFGTYDVSAHAAANGLSAGLSFAYVLSASDDQAALASDASKQNRHENSAKVEFTVNDTARYANIPMEKVEKYVRNHFLQGDSLVQTEVIEESYHLPRIKLNVTTHDTTYVTISVNDALLNRYRIRRDTSFAINDLGALDIHNAVRIVGRAENSSSADTLTLPDVSATSSTPAIKQNEYRFHIFERDSTHLGRMVEVIQKLLPEAKKVVVRTPHGDSWAAIENKLRVALGSQPKFRQEYNAKEILVLVND